jgi:hypothetical protein
MTTVSYELQAKGIRGVLVVMAERGLITELRCVMPTCYCAGGRASSILSPLLRTTGYRRRITSHLPRSTVDTSFPRTSGWRTSCATGSTSARSQVTRRDARRRRSSKPIGSMHIPGNVPPRKPSGLRLEGRKGWADTNRLARGLTTITNDLLLTTTRPGWIVEEAKGVHRAQLLPRPSTRYPLAGDSTVTDWDPLRGTDWSRLLRQEFEKPYWAKLQDFVEEERSRHDVYPPDDEVFAALHLTPCAKTKVVIVGQDPYPGAGRAHGLCFSIRRGVQVPRSLANIFRAAR